MAFSKVKPTQALIVQDDPATRTVEEIVLEADKLAVLTAKNAEEGIRLARERCPAVILLDLAPPTACSFDVLKTKKRAGDTAPIAVVCEPGGTLCHAWRVRMPTEAVRHRRVGRQGPAIWRASPSSRPSL
jgi:DNA-binding NtrC family response regulator